MMNFLPKRDGVKFDAIPQSGITDLLQSELLPNLKTPSTFPELNKTIPQSGINRPFQNPAFDNLKKLGNIFNLFKGKSSIGDFAKSIPLSGIMQSANVVSETVSPSDVMPTVFEPENSGEIKINYSPKIIIQGNADEGVVGQIGNALADSRAELEDFILRVVERQKNNLRRVSFA